MMKRIEVWSLSPALAALTVIALAAAADGNPSSEASGPLRPATAFASIDDEAERSVAFFTEAGRVLTHPRCVNCHPAGDQPLQGEDGRPHQPTVRRGPVDFGVVGMTCEVCHQEENFDPGRVPGDAVWHLAPIEAAWEGKSLGEICQQLKDPARNGERDLEQIAVHMEEDSLVGWAWEPGAGRQPAPGSHEVFGELVRAWIETGAVCPD